MKIRILRNIKRQKLLLKKYEVIEAEIKTFEVIGSNSARIAITENGNLHGYEFEILPSEEPK